MQHADAIELFLPHPDASTQIAPPFDFIFPSSTFRERTLFNVFTHLQALR